MAIVYPGSLDNFVNPTAVDTLKTPSHSGQHTDLNNAVEALEAKVGVNGSAVVTSHDYKITDQGSRITTLEGKFPIVNADLGVDCVDGSKIANLSVDSEHYVLGSIDGVHIANDAIDSQHYVDGSIDFQHLNSNILDFGYDAALSSATQTLSTTNKTIISRTLTNPYVGFALVNCTFDWECTSTSALTTAIGELTVAGAVQSGQALFAARDAGLRVTTTITYIVPLSTIASRTYAMVARKDNTSTNYEVNNVHSRMTIVFFRS